MQKDSRFIIPFFLFVVLGYATTKSPIVKKQPSDHPRLYSNSKNTGNHHVIDIIEHRNEKIDIHILNRYEEPEYMDVGKNTGRNIS